MRLGTLGAITFAMLSESVSPSVLPLSETLRGWLDRVNELGTGELVVDTGQGIGRVFLHRGHVAWVVADRRGERLSGALTRRTSLDRPTLRESFDRCRNTGANFAEDLVARGLVPRDTMREVLRGHNASELARLSEASAEPRVLFQPTSRRYASDFLFSVDELFVDERPLRASERVARPPENLQENARMANIKESLDEVMKLDGAIAAALVDWESGLTLGTIGGGPGFDIELAASGNTSVVKAKMGVMRALGIQGGIEDFLITLGTQYHLIRPLTKNPSLFLYVAIDKEKGNLGLARHRVRALEEGLTL